MKVMSDSIAVQKIAMEMSEQVKKSIESAADLTDDQKNKAKNAVDETTYTPFEVPNTSVYKIAVGALSAAAGVLVLGGVLLAFQSGNSNLPEFLQVTLATIIGALAGMIVPTAKTGL
ncbi:MAG: hypothetical protein QNJ40_16125 [Xanthomonadales bacterium]|nr:hypothetical protein [Xanthomonadales bacterium]